MGLYDHTQRGWLHLLLAPIAIAGIAAGLALVPDDPGAWILVGVGALFGLLAPCFAHLRVRDDGDALRLEFGPWRVFRRTVRYAEIEAAGPDRTALIDGWGIHYVPLRGWTWNIRGFRAVRIDLRSGGTLRVGTDDPDGLAAFLRTRIADPG